MAFLFAIVEPFRPYMPSKNLPHVPSWNPSQLYWWTLVFDHKSNPKSWAPVSFRLLYLEAHSVDWIQLAIDFCLVYTHTHTSCARYYPKLLFYLYRHSVIVCNHKFSQNRFTKLLMIYRKRVVSKICYWGGYWLDAFWHNARLHEQQQTTFRAKFQPIQTFTLYVIHSLFG